MLTGEFYGEQEYDGRMVLVRHSCVREFNEASWSQAFSVDGGQSWETNWTATFSRIAESARARATRPSVRDSVQTPEAERRRARAPRHDAGDVSPMTYCCYNLDIRRYAVPERGARTLIELFDRENDLVRQMSDANEVQSMYAVTWTENIALFRDVDRPNVYTWFRGLASYTSMETHAFYFGPIWAKHREVVQRAGITMREAYGVAPGSYAAGFVLLETVRRNR